MAVIVGNSPSPATIIAMARAGAIEHALDRFIIGGFDREADLQGLTTRERPDLIP
jgi:hypothetical protein